MRRKPRTPRPQQIHAYCQRCQHTQLFVPHEVNHKAYLGLSLLSLGLWAVSWVAACIGARIYPWRCEHCGWQKPEFNSLPDQPRFDPSQVGPCGPAAMELKGRAEIYRKHSRELSE